MFDTVYGVYVSIIAARTQATATDHNANGEHATMNHSRCQSTDSSLSDP
jgi:hypothetical protein